METTKTCTKCGRTLPLEKFNKSSKNKDGYRHFCKDCIHKYYIQYRDKKVKFSEAVRQANPLESFKTNELITELKKRQSKLSLLKQLIFN